MSKEVLKNCKLFYDKYDLSADHEKLSLKMEIEAADKTVFGESSRGRAVGLKNFDVVHSGFFEAGSDAVDDVLYDNLGTAGRILTILPTDSEGGKGYMSKLVSLKYEPAGNIGDMFGITGEAHSEGTGIVRCTVLGIGTKTTDGNGSAYELGALSSGQYLYAALHVTSASGDSLVVKIQSDSAEGFASPTDRVTFTTVTGATAEWATRIDGSSNPITDTWWRATWDVTGSPTSYDICVSMGII